MENEFKNQKKEGKHAITIFYCFKQISGNEGSQECRVELIRYIQHAFFYL